MIDGEPVADGARLLVVDDDPTVLRSMRRALERVGFEVLTAESGAEAEKAVREGEPDVALLDLALPDMSGIELMKKIKLHDPTIECVIFTGHTSAPVAVEAYDAGAVEYFEKPITDWRRFEQVLHRSVRLRRLARERDAAPVEAERDLPAAEALVRRELTGGSKAIDDLRRSVIQLAGRASPVVLIGASGAGKSRVAEVMHRVGGRAGSLELVSCSAWQGSEMYAELFGRVDEGRPGSGRPGAMERAAGGTIVLDDVGMLSPELQQDLLWVLERRAFLPEGASTAVPLQARVVVTSCEDLDAMALAGRFREDLVGRLGIRLMVPPLNDRREDVPQLTYQILRRVNHEEGLEIKRVPSEVLQLLIEHDWSVGNIRALRLAVEQAAIYSRGEALELAALPQEIRSGGRGRGGSEVVVLSPTDGRLPERYRGLSYQDFKDRLLGDFMALYLRDLLEATDGNVTRSARLADLHRPNFRRLMKKYGVEADDEDPQAGAR